MKENTKKSDSLPYSFVEGSPMNNEWLGKMLELKLLEHSEFQPPHTTMELPARFVDCELLPELDENGAFILEVKFVPGDKVGWYYANRDKNIIKKCEANKLTSRERHLPPLVSASDIYEGESGKPECEEFNIKEIGERLEYELLQIPDFQSPHTTADKPVHILGYGVIPEPDERGVYMAFLDFLPGDKVSQYYEKILKQLGVAPQSDNGTSAKRQKA